MKQMRIIVIPLLVDISFHNLLKKYIYSSSNISSREPKKELNAKFKVM